MTSVPDQLRIAYQNFNPTKSIKKSDPFYVACTHHESILQSIIARIELETDSFVHCLFSGHVGCGKTTEIYTLVDQLTDKGYFPVLLNAVEDLDINNIDRTDLIFVLAKKIFENPALNRIIPEVFWTELQTWFGEIISEKEDLQSSELKIGFGGEIGKSLPFLAKVFVHGNGQISRGGSNRQKYREYYRKNISELLRLFNNLLDAANEALYQKHQKGLILIIDDMEKMNRSKTEEGDLADVVLFVTNSQIWKAVNAHTIFTTPMFLLNSQHRTQLQNRGFFIDTLPVITIRSRDGQPETVQRQVFKDIVSRRLAGLDRLEHLQLFGNKDALLEKIIDFSGGQLRYFILLMNKIIFELIKTNQFPISESIIETVLNEEVNQLDLAIYSNRYPRLKVIADKKELHQLTDDDQTDYEMVNAGWVLQYKNGKYWYDVLPGIRRLPRFTSS